VLEWKTSKNEQRGMKLPGVKEAKKIQKRTAHEDDGPDLNCSSAILRRSEKTCLMMFNALMK
jgi:hypothetical protein